MINIGDSNQIERHCGAEDGSGRRFDRCRQVDPYCWHQADDHGDASPLSADRANAEFFLTVNNPFDRDSVIAAFPEFAFGRANGAGLGPH